MSVGDVIKQHRNMLNLTQRELGDAMCHAGNTVCFWESGRSTPNIYEIPKLCRSLIISPNDLF